MALAVEKTVFKLPRRFLGAGERWSHEQDHSGYRKRNADRMGPFRKRTCRSETLQGAQNRSMGSRSEGAEAMVEKLRITQESEESEGEALVVLRVHGEPRAHNVGPLATMLEPMVSVACCRVRVRFENVKGVDSSTLGLYPPARMMCELMAGVHGVSRSRRESTSTRSTAPMVQGPGS